MKTTINEQSKKGVFNRLKMSRLMKSGLIPGLIFTLMIISIPDLDAHCDSYDGPVIKDALKALKENNVELVLKWINPSQEKVIIQLFSKTQSLKKGDQEIYTIVETYFLETLVRLHRETEGAPYTGLKPAGNTSPIVLMADKSVESADIEDLSGKFQTHIDKVVREKFQKVIELQKVKDVSVERGREYVAAYIDYTHTLEGIHSIIDGKGSDHKH